MALTYPGHFSDGRSAARIGVRVRLAETALIVSSDDGAAVATGPYTDLKLVDERRRGQPIRLTSAADPDARLTVADVELYAPLVAAAPHLGGSTPWLRVAAWGGGIAALIAALVFALPRLAEPVAALIPVAWEAELGERVADALIADARVCTSDAGGAALARLVDRLAATVDAPYLFTVRIADAGTVNAFAAPGGHIVIFRGLLEFAESPDEVAGVLAHVMAHVAERHATEAIVRAAGVSLLFEVLTGGASGLAGFGADLGELLLALSYSRRDEADADATAAAMLEAADIGAAGLGRFLARLDRHEGGLPEGLAFLSTHPPSRARAAAVAAPAGARQPAMPAADWRALESICDRSAARKRR